VDRWTLTYEGFDPERQRARESLCTLGNGYFATRGAPVDAVADGVHYPGTYFAGGYNRLTTRLAGRDVENEDLVNCPNWLPVTVRFDDGPWLRASKLEHLEHVQELDLKTGILRRNLRLKDHDGRILQWRERRLVSMANPHLAALSIELTFENWSGSVTIRSGLDGGVINGGVERYGALASRHLETLASLADDGALVLRSRFRQSRVELAMAARTRLTRGGAVAPATRSVERNDDSISELFCIDVATGETVTIDKTVTLFTSRDHAISEPLSAAMIELESSEGFEQHAEAHRRAWAQLWNIFHIDIESQADHNSEMKLHLHIFHLLQTVSPHSVELDIGVPARGWHGEAYRGHIFWDELFIFPFVNLRMPMITRALLLYRCRRLPEARRAARQIGLKGAMFPWQSGSSGREETQQVHLNPMSGRWTPDLTHRQRHVNAAIAYNVWQYHQVTEDREFLVTHGAELMLEICRFWASLAEFDAEQDRYVIRGVMGPDEFHTAAGGKSAADGGVTNNAYTNLMVSWTIARTLDVFATLSESDRQRLHAILEIAPTELERWDHISRNLVIPFHDDGIISQFEGYERLQELDWEDYASRYDNLQRLDRILEAENRNINDYKVSKQPDVLMLFFLFSTEELRELFDRLGYRFTPEMIGRNIQYYIARTSHGSTLSWVTHAWILSRWDRARSWRLFNQALDSDFGDAQGGTTAEGIHLGAMAGSVDLLQRCYTGVEVRANMLSFNPLLPDELQRLETVLRYRGHTLDLCVTDRQLRVSSRSCTAAPILIAYRGQVRAISPGQSYTFRLIAPIEKRSELQGSL
jgi:trehalose/maltose hydrolase-like predicted phosphorylase